MTVSFRLTGSSRRQHKTTTHDIQTNLAFCAFVERHESTGIMTLASSLRFAYADLNEPSVFWLEGAW